MYRRRRKDILTAKKANGTVIMLSKEMEKKQLREWRQSKKFFCPQCEQPVRLKVGDIVIPHFAHQSDDSCSSSFSEGESEEHLTGKHQLYEFFRKQVDNVVLEPYFKLLAQRPDLLITIGSKKVPIEFQCSTIPVNKVELRTKGYQSVGMKPIWILQTPAQFRTLEKGVGTFQFSKFHKSFFMNNSPEGTVFLTYNPQSELFHYFSSLIHIAGNRYVGIHRTLPISAQTFPFARAKAPTVEMLRQFVSVYLSHRNAFLRSRVLVNRKGINDPFLRNCYDLKIPPNGLPLWIGLPVSFSDTFREHKCEWQLNLVYFMRQNRLNFTNLSERLIRKFLSRQQMPTEGQVQACVAYRDYLLSVDVKSPIRNAVFDEEKIVRLFAEHFLAKCNEN